MGSTRKSAPTAKRPKGAANPLRGSSTAERSAHNREAAGSTPAPATINTGGLTPQQARFVVEYLKDCNATRAAIRAGYSPRTADRQGSRLLRHRGVQQAVVGRRPAAEVIAVAKMELSVERTKQEIARLAYFDPRKLFRSDGKPLAITELDDDTAAAVAGLDVLEEYDGSGEERTLVGHVKKWKIGDKNSALEKAAKILGLYEADHRQQAAGLAEALRAMLAPLQSGIARLPIAK